MIRSMTGYGRGEVEAGGYRFLAEIKSVNHRFLNTHIRLPREFSHLESFVAARCATRCERGHLAVNVEIEAVGSADGLVVFQSILKWSRESLLEGNLKTMTSEAQAVLNR